MTNKPFGSMTKKELIDQIRNISQESLQWKNKANSALEEIQAQREKINNISKNIQGQQGSVSSLLADMKEKQNEADSVLAEMAEQKDDAQESMRSNKEKMEELKQRIEKLLPGAASAGLASSFHKAQEKTGLLVFFWVGFVGSLFLATGGYGYFFYDSLSDNDVLTWGHVFIRLTLGIPLFWIAWYCQRSISQINRIKEEYQHKERLMTVFDGFSRKIEAMSEAGESATQMRLIETVIEAIARNPAQVLDPSATMLDSMFHRKKKEDK